MESFLTTLPPYVQQYLNKYPPTEVFNVLKELICFAVLYSNDRERINLQTLDLLQQGANHAAVHKPYTSYSPSLNLASSSPSMMTVLSSASSEQSNQQLSPTTVNKMFPTPSPSTLNKQYPATPATATTPKKAAPDVGIEAKHVSISYCDSILEEDSDDLGRPTASNTITNANINTDSTAVLSREEVPAAGKPSEKSTMPYTFPEWWAHIDSATDSNDTKKNYTVDQPTLTSPPEKMTEAEMNITNWIPFDQNKTSKPTRNRSTSRPVSMYNPTIPELRSYLDAGKAKKSPVQQTKDTAKASRRMSAPVSPICESPVTNSATANIPAASPPLSESSSTSMSRTASYRPGQTATVRARAEKAKMRQLQLEEEKRKKAEAALTPRSSLRMRQQANSGIDWENIKNQRRKTMPVCGSKT